MTIPLSNTTWFTSSLSILCTDISLERDPQKEQNDDPKCNIFGIGSTITITSPLDILLFKFKRIVNVNLQ